MVKTIAPKMIECNEEFNSDELGRIMKGLNSKSSSNSEVRTLLSALAVKIKKCNTSFIVF